VIVVRNPSGEGGDVELSARTLEKFLVFAFGLISLVACSTFFALIACHCYIHLSHVHVVAPLIFIVH